jgi:hypothetical protein
MGLMKTDRAKGETNLLQAHLARLETVENCDVVCHDSSRKQTTSSNSKQVTLEEEHRRVVKSITEQWAVVATIKVVSNGGKIDLKKIKPSPNPYIVTTINFFRRGAAVQLNLAGPPIHPNAKRFQDFRDAHELFELMSHTVDPYLNQDRATHFDEAIQIRNHPTIVRRFPNEIHYTPIWDSSVLITGTTVVDPVSGTPLRYSSTRNPSYTGKGKDLEYNTLYTYKHSLIKDIPLPTQKIVKVPTEEEKSGQVVHIEFDATIDLKWLQVNEELAFPDVDKIASSYGNLYEFIFQEPL